MRGSRSQHFSSPRLPYSWRTAGARGVGWAAFYPNTFFASAFPSSLLITYQVHPPSTNSFLCWISSEYRVIACRLPSYPHPTPSTPPLSSTLKYSHTRCPQINTGLATAQGCTRDNLGLEQKINTYRKHRYFQILDPHRPGSIHQGQLVHFHPDHTEKPPGFLYLCDSTMNLKSAYSAQELGLRLLKPSLVAPGGHLQPHHARQVGCVVGPVPLSLFNGCIRFVKPAFPTKHPRQFAEGVTGSFVPILRS